MSETATASPDGYARDIIAALDGTWRTAGQIRHLLGYGQVLEVANCLERLWRLGLIEQDAQAIGIGAKRKGGGEEFRMRKYRQRQRTRASEDVAERKAGYDG